MYEKRERERERERGSRFLHFIGPQEMKREGEREVQDFSTL
jgi:hypothetical protein